MYSIFKKHIKEHTGLVLRFDDISENMNWKLMEKCESLFDEFNIKPVLGVIPNNKDSEFLIFPKKDNFWSILKKWQDKGWEISMHGYCHVYDKETNKKDYFGYGGKSEFFGHTYEEQLSRIKRGLQIFKDNNIQIKSFFAPNHTYDNNTFKALKDVGIREVIDGYGLFPYEKNGIKFFPQLFYKLLLLPYGIQATQIHLNYWNEKDFENFEIFIRKNFKNILSFDEGLKKINNNNFSLLLKFLSMHTLKLIRIFN